MFYAVPLTAVAERDTSRLIKLLAISSPAALDEKETRQVGAFGLLCCFDALKQAPEDVKHAQLAGQVSGPISFPEVLRNR